MILGAGRQRYGPEHRFTRAGDLPHWTLELTSSGTMLRRFGGESRFEVQPNDTLLLTPPETPYALRGASAGDEIWVIFQPRPELIPCLEWPRGLHGIRILPVSRNAAGRRLVRAFDEVHSHLESRHPRRDLLAENALERLILLADTSAADADASSDSRIQRALDILHESFQRPITVPVLASEVGLSPSRFAHLFRAETGRSPMDYLEAMRMEQARLLLLRTDLSVQEIATRVGYEDAYYFSTRFRRRTGCPPTTWRKAPGNVEGRGFTFAKPAE